MTSQTLRTSGFLGPKFNRFLFASIGEDQRGTPLSVVSALGRLDLDAWAEAASLARLPRPAAIAKLAGWISRFTEFPLIVKESQATARRLVALLPDGAPAQAQPVAKQSGHSEMHGLTLATLLMLAVMGVLLARQTLMPGAAAPAPHAQSTVSTIPAPAASRL